MSTRTYLFTDPEWCEFVFNVMHTASPEQKALLDFNELKHFKNEATMRQFAENEGLEKRMLMLTRLGISFVMIAYPTARMQLVEEFIFDTDKQFDKRGLTKQEIVKKMAEGNLFVMSSKDIMMSCLMAAQNSHSLLFILNYAYVKYHQMLSDLRREPALQDYKDAVAGYDLMAKISLMAMNMDDGMVQSICGVNMYEMRILLSLFPYRNTFVKVDVISLRIGQVLRDRNKGVAKVCNYLLQKEMVMQMPGWEGKRRKPYFTISEKGMQTVHKYSQYLFNQVESLN